MKFPSMRPLRLAALLAAGALLGGAPVLAQGLQPNELLLARSLAATCANCHGTNGHAVGDMKPIAGVPVDKMIAMLADYRSGNQPATIMHQIVKGYTEEQIRLIANYLSAIPARK
jgi:sulfide dehydrogenase cytochrome subunit